MPPLSSNWLEEVDPVTQGWVEAFPIQTERHRDNQGADKRHHPKIWTTPDLRNRQWTSIHSSPGAHTDVEIKMKTAY